MFLDEVASLIQNEVVNQGQVPDEPNDVVVLNYTGGNSDRSLGKKKVSVNYPSFQIRVRGTSYFNTLERIKTIRETLEGYIGVLGDYKIRGILVNGDVMPLGRDDKLRYEFTLNMYGIVDEEQQDSN